MELRNKIQQNAINLVVKANSNLKQEVDRATEAELCGMTRDEYWLVRVQNIIQEKAALLRISPWEYQLRLAEQSGINVSAIRDEYRRSKAEALGLDPLA